MCRQVGASPSVPIKWNRLDYISGTNEYIPVQPELKQQVLDLYKENPEQARQQFGADPFELKNVLKYWVRSRDPQFHCIPTDTLYMTIDKAAVRRSGMMMPTDSIPDRMAISLVGKDGLMKSDIMMLEMIANCNWTRPLYVAITVGSDNFMNLGDNFIQEGLLNRITPFYTKEAGSFDTEKTYNLVMNKFRWGGVATKGVYLDETVLRMCYTHRREMAQLAMNLLLEGKRDKALKVLEKAEKELPTYNVPLSFSHVKGGPIMADAYAMLGKKAKAEAMYNAMWKTSAQYVRYYLSLPANTFNMNMSSCAMHLQIMYQYIRANEQNNPQWANARNAELMGMLKAYEAKGGKMQ